MWWFQLLTDGAINEYVCTQILFAQIPYESGSHFYFCLVINICIHSYWCSSGEGHIIVARSLTKTGRLEPVTAEALLAFHAAEFSRDMGLQTIFIQGDGCPTNSECCEINRSQLEQNLTVNGGYTWGARIDAQLTD